MKTPNAEIRFLETPAELESAYNILRELRRELDRDAFRSIYQEAKRRDEFAFAGFFIQERCVAVMGYRFLFDFVHGKHLYIDDLVVLPADRSQGVGAKMLAFAEFQSAKNNCRGLRLCTGFSNEGARRFYERNHWSAKSIAFKKVPT